MPAGCRLCSVLAGSVLTDLALAGSVLRGPSVRPVPAVFFGLRGFSGLAGPDACLPTPDALPVLLGVPAALYPSVLRFLPEPGLRKLFSHGPGTGPFAAQLPG